MSQHYTEMEAPARGDGLPEVKLLNSLDIYHIDVFVCK